MSEEQNEESEQPTEADTDSAADQPTDQTDENTESTASGEPADTAEASEEEQEDSQAEADKWKSLARKHERENSKARRELDQLREQHETDVSEANNALASERLHTKLARAGMSEEDASALIEHIDSKRLVEDGKPSAKAIESVAASLSRSLTRGVDEDQGQTSETPSFSADQWLRKKARK